MVFKEAVAHLQKSEPFKAACLGGRREPGQARRRRRVSMQRLGWAPGGAFPDEAPSPRRARRQTLPRNAAGSVGGSPRRPILCSRGHAHRANTQAWRSLLLPPTLGSILLRAGEGRFLRVALEPLAGVSRSPAHSSLKKCSSALAGRGVLHRPRKMGSRSS